MSRRIPGNGTDPDFGDVRGMYGDAISLQVADSGSFKAGKRKNRPYRTGTADTFRRGPVAVNEQAAARSN